MDRKTAKELGLKTYINGTPCRQGHLNAERLTINSRCIICKSLHEKSEEMRKYKAEHYLKNRKDIRTQQEEHRNLKRDSINEQKRGHYKLNRETILTQQKEYRQANPERVKESKKRTRETHPETMKIWRSNNKDRVNAHNMSRHAAKLQRTPPWVKTDKEHQKLILAKYTEARQITEETGILQHVDHIVPLQGELVSGLHVWWNLQVIPAVENLSKKNKFELI